MYVESNSDYTPVVTPGTTGHITLSCGYHGQLFTLPHKSAPLETLWYKIFLQYHTGVPHSKTTHQYHTAIPHSITQQYHTAIPHRSTTQQNHTLVPHSSNTTQQYHTAVPHSSTTQHYHTAFTPCGIFCGITIYHKSTTALLYGSFVV